MTFFKFSFYKIGHFNFFLLSELYMKINIIEFKKKSIGNSEWSVGIIKLKYNLIITKIPLKYLLCFKILLIN